MPNQNRTYGYFRDKEIAYFVDKFKCLDAEQIKLLFIANTCNPASAIRQTQNVMKRLTERKKLIYRSRLDAYEPYKYFITDFEQKEHIVLLNWLVIWFIAKLKYEKVYYMEYQRNYVVKIPDLFMVTHNYVTKEYRSYFFEMDKTVSNKFDAIAKYNLLFEAKPFDEYVKLTAPMFPKIIIATTELSRLKNINHLKEVENKHNLRFDTHLIWDIKEECLHEKVKDFSNKFMFGSD